MGLGRLTFAISNLLNAYYFTPDAYRFAAGNTFTAFVSATGLTLYQLFAGTLSDAVNTMRHEYIKSRRQTRIVISIVQLIAWCVLFAMIDVGTRLAWGERALYVNLTIGVICAIASVIIVSVLYDPAKSA